MIYGNESYETFFEFLVTLIIVLTFYFTTNMFIYIPAIIIATIVMAYRIIQTRKEVIQRVMYVCDKLKVNREVYISYDTIREQSEDNDE
ncbi:MAG: hypothetical protein AB1444_14905 [Spirochaetota bacterium]